MAGNKTLTMIKPEAVANGNIGAILNKIETEGFKILAVKMRKLSKEQAEEFYAVHKGRPFYEGLVEYMTSGPIVAAVLEKENAVVDFRKIVGATDPNEAEEGTIRQMYAESKTRNAVHGSDSDENAQIEINFHFNENELISY